MQSVPEKETMDAIAELFKALPILPGCIFWRFCPDRSCA